MRDLVFILLTVAFFGLAYAYVAGCARLLGRDKSGEAPVDIEPQSGVPR